MTKVLKYSIDKRINFHELVISANILDADYILECVGETKRFLWIPAKDKYVLTVGYEKEVQLSAIQGYIAGALS